MTRDGVDGYALYLQIQRLRALLAGALPVDGDEARIDIVLLALLR